MTFRPRFTVLISIDDTTIAVGRFLHTANAEVYGQAVQAAGHGTFIGVAQCLSTDEFRVKLITTGTKNPQLPAPEYAVRRLC